MNRSLVLVLVPALSLTACASSSLLPSPNLLDATRTLARVEASPSASDITADLTAAEAALTAAEQDHAARPTTLRAADSAYLAQRAAERARIAALYTAEREALDKARRAVDRLRRALARRDALLAAVDRQRDDQAQAEAALHRAHREALEAAADPDAELLERPDGLLYRLSAESTFLPGTSLLRSGAERRLAALARVLAAARPLEIRLQLLDDLPGVGTGAYLLAGRRLQRLHDALRRGGVPAEFFLAPERHPPPGAQVDVLVIDPPVVLPSPDPGPS